MDNNSIILIQTISQTIDVVNNVLLKEEVIAIDCEGISLSREGRLTLLQVSSLHVYIHTYIYFR